MTPQYRCGCPGCNTHRGKCRTPLQGYKTDVETVKVAADPADAPLAAMGVPVQAKHIPVRVIYTHEPCGCEYWAAPS